MRLVNIETPFSGDTPQAIERNVIYARACMRDCIRRGEAPIASHLLYTQPGILDDKIKVERDTGIACGFAWNAHAAATVVYTDLGISKGMQDGIDNAGEAGRPIEWRTLGPYWHEEVCAIMASRGLGFAAVGMGPTR